MENVVKHGANRTMEMCMLTACMAVRSDKRGPAIEACMLVRMAIGDRPCVAVPPLALNRAPNQRPFDDAADSIPDISHRMSS